ncbi:response regulator [Ectothiorhodospiraceae bacterium WFHF3C12]|nr:response regulator [Ectothiorhodospiraceae bacterium WFHF3C12]
MDGNPSILIVDDDSQIRSLLSEYLADKGFDVHTAADADSARRALAAAPPQLVLLDLNMPGEDGLSLARHIREHLDIGIIMVTAAGETVDRIIGLEVGADDYIAKPFDNRELLARVKGVLRRLGPREPAVAARHARSLRFGDCVLDLDARCLHDADGREIPITQMEFDLLQVFGTRPNRVLSRDDILDLTQNRDWNPYDRSVDIRVARLRKKIERNPESPRMLRTVRGVGYMFVPETTTAPADD